jgi:Raf kinase inhibitor-like YbhB/YbcL family protein
MELISPDFKHNELIPSKFTCDGENISPTLEVFEIPEGTESLVLIVEDPDASSGTWIHWLVWNIDKNTEMIPAGHTPAGSIEGTTSFGQPGYGGPCPPSGIHRYFFKLYALAKKINLAATSTVDEVEKAMNNITLGQCELVGLYSSNEISR